LAYSKKAQGSASIHGLCKFLQKVHRGDFSEIARPINDLTKKNRPGNGENKKKHLTELKRRFTSAPVLKMPDPDKQYRMECDASNFATGAILSQEYEDHWHPVAFQSKSFNETERNYEIHDKELAAIIEL
jgi:hypothetical protein